MVALTGCPSESKAPPRTAGGARPAKAKPKKKGAYEGMASVPSAGKITGVVKYGGDKSDPTVTIEKDKCQHAAGTRPEKALLVEGGLVSNAVVYIDKIAKGKNKPLVMA